MIARVTPDESDAQNPALLRRDQLAETADVALGQGPVVLVERKGLDADVSAMGLAGLGFGQADRGQFGVAIGHARHGQRIGVDRHGEDGPAYEQ